MFVLFSIESNSEEERRDLQPLRGSQIDASHIPKKRKEKEKSLQKSSQKRKKKLNQQRKKQNLGREERTKKL